MSTEPTSNTDDGRLYPELSSTCRETVTSAQRPLVGREDLSIEAAEARTDPLLDQWLGFVE
jgi:hypothetical protein